MGFLEYAKKTWGVGGYAQLKEGVNAKIDLDKLSPKEWYPDALSEKILRWIGENKGPEHVTRAGGHALKNPSKLLGFILHFASIKSILKRAPETYADTFNYGKMKIDMRDKDAVIYMKDTAMHEYTCLAWLGAFQAMLEVAGANGTVKEVACQRDGAKACEFLMEWQ